MLPSPDGRSTLLLRLVHHCVFSSASIADGDLSMAGVAGGAFGEPGAAGGVRQEEVIICLSDMESEDEVVCITAAAPQPRMFLKPHKFFNVARMKPRRN